MLCWCGWFRWRAWDRVCALLGRSAADRVAASTPRLFHVPCRRASRSVEQTSTRESGSIRQLSLQSKFLPSFRERYSPPNPGSASIGRNLGWRNSARASIKSSKYRKCVWLSFWYIQLPVLFPVKSLSRPQNSGHFGNLMGDQTPRAAALPKVPHVLHYAYEMKYPF